MSPIAQAQELNRAGKQAIAKGDLKLAQQQHMEAIRLLRNIPNHLEAAKAYRGIGRIAFLLGDFPRAESAWLEDVSILSAADPQTYDLSKCYANLGALAEAQSDLSKAASYLERALSIQSAAHKPEDYALTLNNLAIVDLERADYQKADELVGKAVDLHRRYLPGSGYLADVLDTAARIKRAEGRLHDAQQLYYEAELTVSKVAPNSPTAADIEEGLSEVLTDTGHLAEAKQHANAALRLRDLLTPRSDRGALVWGTLGRIARIQHYTVTTRNCYQRAMALLDQDVSLLNLGITESQVRGQYSDLYAEYIDFLVTEEHDTSRALEVLEQLRARTFLEMLQNARVDVRGEDPTLLSERQTLLATLAALSGQRMRLVANPHTESEKTSLNLRIDSVLAEITRLDYGILKAHPRLADVTRPVLLRAKDISELLDDDSVMLEFVLASPRSFVFAVTSSKIKVYQLPDRQDINRVAAQLYQRWSESPTVRAHTEAEAGATYSQQLAEMILSPLWSVIKAKNRIVVVADGALNYIPFGALPGSPAHTSPALAAEHEMVNVPSASVLSLMRSRPHSEKATKTAVVFADPVFNSSDPRLRQRSPVAINPGMSSNRLFQRLLYSRREANYISALLPGTTQKLDFAANRRAALDADLAQYRIVHFATHGVLDNLSPGLSALVLSQIDENGNPQPGNLTLQDFYHLHLRADLVVLSACKTALGGDTGEGLIGLTRGCMFSGARRVISSLWEVNDEATAALMKSFYTAMQHGVASPAALRLAQLQISKLPGWEQPYYWAGFVIQGDWLTSH